MTVRIGKMKKFFVLLMMLLPVALWANEVKVEINPPRPVVGEVFQAYFRIFTDSNEAPVINFSPSSLEVTGKSNQGVSTRTIYANGKLTVTREVTIVYDLVASREGLAQLRDINVKVGNINLKHASININVLKEAEVRPDVFVMADVPKKSIFLGEGLTVRYYLYSKVQVSHLDVKKYPKLNNFLKRFLQEADRSERVTVDGNLYLRTQIYAAKLFAEKLGELKIDPLQLTATFATSRPNDPFGGFGLSRDFRTKTISSETVKIEVRPLPLPIPTHFTGLIGKHDFELQFGTSRLIVNEPMEIKLTISGGGALENLEPPEIIKHPGLEEFETNGDLKIAGPDFASKIFNYTFLAQQNLQIPASTITLSYFDPASEKYVPVNLEVPEVVVAGATDRPATAKSGNNSGPAPKPVTPSTVAPITLAAPVVEFSLLSRWLPYINIGLSGLALLIAVGWVLRQNGVPKFQRHREIPGRFKRGDFELAEFLRWLDPVIYKTGKPPLAAIKQAPLKDETKRYFIDLLNANDYKNYSSSKSPFQFVYKAGHFKELSKYIESVSNESSSQSA
jgi:hypothetical protein